MLGVHFCIDNKHFCIRNDVDADGAQRIVWKPGDTCSMLQTGAVRTLPESQRWITVRPPVPARACARQGSARLSAGPGPTPPRAQPRPSGWRARPERKAQIVIGTGARTLKRVEGLEMAQRSVEGHRSAPVTVERGVSTQHLLELGQRPPVMQR